MNLTTRSIRACACCRVAALIIACAVRPLLAADAATDSEASAKTLIEKLGNRQFSERETATDRLVEMDVSIRPLLERAMKSSDAEVRSRSRRVLLVINERDLQNRLAAFAADTEDKLHLTLPGWLRYQQIVGKDKAARELFVDMFRAEPRLMEATESRLQSVNELLAERARELYTTFYLGGGVSRPASATSIAAILLVASDPQVALNGDAPFLISSLTQQGVYFTTGNNLRADQYKRILGAWITRDTSDTNVLWQSLSTALAQNLPEGRALARNVLGKQTLPPQMKQQAISLLARTGDKTDATLLVPLLDDASILQNNNPNGQHDRDNVKVADYAMAIMMHLTGQKPKDFGMDRADLQQGWNLKVETISFRTEEDREAVSKKWKSWWDENKSNFAADSK
jgi:hypothetical protein